MKTAAFLLMREHNRLDGLSKEICGNSQFNALSGSMRLGSLNRFHWLSRLGPTREIRWQQLCTTVEPKFVVRPMNSSSSDGSPEAEDATIEASRGFLSPLLHPDRGCISKLTAVESPVGTCVLLFDSRVRPSVSCGDCNSKLKSKFQVQN